MLKKPTKRPHKATQNTNEAPINYGEKDLHKLVFIFI